MLLCNHQYQIHIYIYELITSVSVFMKINVKRFLKFHLFYETLNLRKSTTVLLYQTPLLLSKSKFNLYEA